MELGPSASEAAEMMANSTRQTTFYLQNQIDDIKKELDLVWTELNYVLLRIGHSYD